MLIKCDFRYVCGKSFNKVINAIVEFFGRIGRASVRLITDVRGHNFYRHTLAAMTDLLCFYVDMSTKDLLLDRCLYRCH